MAVQKLIAAALSPAFIPGDVERNLASAHRGLLAAKKRGVELAVFSEWYLTNCVDQRSYQVAQPVPDGPAARQVIDWARELKITVAMGIEELDPQTGVVYNAHFLAGPNGYIGKHRKTHLMASEMPFHRAASVLRSHDIGACRVGINICHENMYPENSRAMVLQGATILISPFGCGGGPEALPKSQWLNDFHMACWRARCFDNGVYMIVSGGNGGPGRTHKYYACVIDPFAEVIAAIESQPEDPQINLVVAEIDFAKVDARRNDPDYPIRKRRPELYGSLVQPY